MKTIIGLGRAANQVAKSFERYDSYSIKNISSFEHCETFESIESESVKLFDNFFVDTDCVLVIIVGGSLMSAAALVLLEKLQGKQVEVLFIRPKLESLEIEERKFDRICFQIIQEKARCGSIDKIYLVSNEIVENLLQELPIGSYWKTINNTIVDYFHFIESLRNTEPVLDNLKKPSKDSRIVTFGAIEFDSLTEVMIYNINHIKEKEVYYVIPDSVLNTNTKLIQKINEQIKKLSNDGKIRVSFAVYESKFDNVQIYARYSSNIVQENEYYINNKQE